jgi:hypothetical protein
MVSEDVDADEAPLLDSGPLIEPEMNPGRKRAHRRCRRRFPRSWRTREPGLEAQASREPSCTGCAANCSWLGGAASADREVEASFLTAIDVARRQDARLLVLRAALSLALVWRRTRRGAEARRHVAAARADPSKTSGCRTSSRPARSSQTTSVETGHCS